MWVQMKRRVTVCTHNTIFTLLFIHFIRVDSVFLHIRARMPVYARKWTTNSRTHTFSHKRSIFSFALTYFFSFQNFLQVFPEPFTRLSKSFNDINIVRRLTAIFLITCLGATNLFDMVNCRYSEKKMKK